MTRQKISPPQFWPPADPIPTYPSRTAAGSYDPGHRRAPASPATARSEPPAREAHTAQTKTERYFHQAQAKDAESHGRKILHARHTTQPAASSPIALR